MVKKDKVNTIKNGYKSSFVLKIEKMKKVSRKPSITMKIPIQEIKVMNTIQKGIPLRTNNKQL